MYNLHTPTLLVSVTSLVSIHSSTLPLYTMSRQEQYHLFSLPPHLLENLIPRDVVNQPSPSPPRSVSPLPPAERTAASARSCNICLGASFADVDSQRSHFRSDWHRYNVKMRLKGSDPVTESQFGKLVDSASRSFLYIGEILTFTRPRGFNFRFSLFI